MERRKVFGLGLSRTGTLSLTAALGHLGMNALHYPSLPLVPQLAEHYDALTDISVIPFAEALDRLYPDCRFVLTVRDESSWLESCARHFERWPAANLVAWKRWTRRAVYGTESFDTDRFLMTYRRHREQVQRRYGDIPGKLLVLDLCGGEGYEQLCPFLDLPSLTAPMPHQNRGLRQ